MWLGEAIRVPGRIAALVSIGSGLALFLPADLAKNLALDGLRNASFFWVVGALFLLATGLVIVRVIEFIADARRAYRDDDDLRTELRSRTQQEREILNRAAKRNVTTLVLEPGLLPEIRPLLELGLLTEVSQPNVKTNEHGIYLVPTRVFQLLQKEQAPKPSKLAEFFERIAQAYSEALFGPARLMALGFEPPPGRSKSAPLGRPRIIQIEQGTLATLRHIISEQRSKDNDLFDASEEREEDGNN